jgi:hypothetical protein
MTHKGMFTFERSVASENESYTDMMNFEMQGAPAIQGTNATMKRKYSWGVAICDKPSEASEFIRTVPSGYFSGGF